MRVIAGTAKGMRLRAPRGEAVRPTSDMVREAIFDILGEAPLEARVLDLFAGTGALAIEALSRGAEEAVLVEQSARCLAFIRDNLARTRLAERARLIHGDVFKEVPKLDLAGEQFGLVLADPPYAARPPQSQGPERDAYERRDHQRRRDDRPAQAPAQRALQLLAETAILAENAILVVEHATGLALPGEAGRLRLTTTRRYGSTSVSFFRSA